MNDKTKQLLAEIIESLYEDCENYDEARAVYDTLQDFLGLIHDNQSELYCDNTLLLKTVCGCEYCTAVFPDPTEPFIS